MNKSKDSQQVLAFFNKNNRPYSLQDVVSAFQNELNKPAIQKALDSLVSSGKILEKVYGKSKIFFLDQSGMVTVGQREIEELDTCLEKCKEEFNDLTSKFKTKEALLLSMTSGMSNEDLEAELMLNQKKLSELQDKMVEVKKRKESGKDDKEGQKNVQTLHKKLQNESRKRKRIAVDIVDAILEGYPKPKKILLEEMGIEQFS